MSIFRGLARISQKTKLTTLGTAMTKDTDIDALLDEFPTRVISQDWKFKYDDAWGTGVTVGGIILSNVLSYQL